MRITDVRYSGSELEADGMPRDYFAYMVATSVHEVPGSVGLRMTATTVIPTAGDGKAFIHDVANAAIEQCHTAALAELDTRHRGLRRELFEKRLGD